MYPILAPSLSSRHNLSTNSFTGWLDKAWYKGSTFTRLTTPPKLLVLVASAGRRTFPFLWRGIFCSEESGHLISGWSFPHQDLLHLWAYIQGVLAQATPLLWLLQLRFSVPLEVLGSEARVKIGKPQGLASEVKGQLWKFWAIIGCQWWTILGTCLQRPSVGTWHHTRTTLTPYGTLAKTESENNRPVAPRTIGELSCSNTN